MTTPSCSELDPLLAERASGTLDPADTARLDAHLAGCARCRAELAAWEQTFAHARLPPVSDAERAAVAQLAARVRADLRRDRASTPVWRVLVAGLAVAAAVVVVLPRRPAPPVANGTAASVAERTAWQEPDPDALLLKVEQQHAELVIAGEDDLAHAERLADAAYVKAVSGE